MTRYRLPMRWADLDQLNHVNNVVYLEYAAEARAALVEDGVLDEGLAPVGVEIEFARPMPLSRRAVVVDQWLDGAVLTQEISHESDGERVVFARLTTRLGTPVDLGAPQVEGTVVPFRGRRGDVDGAGHVDAVRIFEYFQETRVIWMAGRSGESREIGSVVVAHVGVDYGPPVVWRPAPWDVVVGLERIGDKSFTLASEWRDGETVLARNTAVLVAFDVQTQKARSLTEAERAYLKRLASA